MSFRIELWRCPVCLTIDALPAADISGAQAAQNQWIDDHTTNGMRHVTYELGTDGQPKIVTHPDGTKSYVPTTQVKFVPDVKTKDGARPMTSDDWNEPYIRESVSRRLEELAATGLGQEFYDTKQNFQWDAMACFRKHHRNPDCNDYMTDKKLLSPGTEKLRKSEKLPKPVYTRYLCEYCPVHSKVREKRFDEAMKKGTL